MSLSIGQVVNGYELLDSFDSSTERIAFRARNVTKHRIEQIQILPDSLRDDSERSARFYRESRIPVRRPAPASTRRISAFTVTRILSTENSKPIEPPIVKPLHSAANPLPTPPKMAIAEPAPLSPEAPVIAPELPHSKAIELDAPQPRPRPRTGCQPSKMSVRISGQAGYGCRAGARRAGGRGDGCIVFAIKPGASRGAIRRGPEANRIAELQLGAH